MDLCLRAKIERIERRRTLLLLSSSNRIIGTFSGWPVAVQRNDCQACLVLGLLFAWELLWYRQELTERQSDISSPSSALACSRWPMVGSVNADTHRITQLGIVLYQDANRD